jgi:hypothetical protein
MVLSLTHLEGIFTVPERFVHPDHRLGAGRYLSGGFIECNREEFAFVVIVNRLDERIGVLEDRKAIAGDVNLPTSSVYTMSSFCFIGVHQFVWSSRSPSPGLGVPRLVSQEARLAYYDRRGGVGISADLIGGPGTRREVAGRSRTQDSMRLAQSRVAESSNLVV